MKTTKRCWRRFCPFWSLTYKIVLQWPRAPTSKIRNQHLRIVTNFRSPTSQFQQHHFHPKKILGLLPRRLNSYLTCEQTDLVFLFVGQLALFSWSKTPKSINFLIHILDNLIFNLCISKFSGYFFLNSSQFKAYDS